MTEANVAVSADEDTGSGGGEFDAVDEQLVRQLADRARAEGLRLTGEGGLLPRLTKVVVESALEGEMDDHLGYGKHDPAGRYGQNSRNGRRGKTVLTDIGPVEIACRGTGTAASLRSRSTRRPFARPQPLYDPGGSVRSTGA